MEIVMNLEKLAPWNWFKKEEETSGPVPVRRESSEVVPASSATVHPVLQLQEQIDRLFDDVFRGFGLTRNAPAWPANINRPAVDVAGDESGYEITLEVPGIKKSDLHVDVRGDTLYIHGEKSEQSENRDRHYYRVERSYGSFQRILSLPEDADADAIKATLEDGVLTVRIPRKAEAVPESRRIEVE